MSNSSNRSFCFFFILWSKKDEASITFSYFFIHKVYQVCSIRNIFIYSHIKFSLFQFFCYIVDSFLVFIPSI